MDNHIIISPITVNALQWKKVMKKIRIILAIIFISLILFVSAVNHAAASGGMGLSMARHDLQPATAPTLIPTVTSSYTTIDATPELRILPQVGSNAGLVIGASVLVLIIIGGVLGARARQKH